MEPKILYLDLELSTNQNIIENYGLKLWYTRMSAASITRDFSIFCASWKWISGGPDKKVHNVCVDPDDVFNDENVVRTVWDLVNEADIIVGHNCVEKSTPVLKADMTWVPVGDLKEGDELVGFDEGYDPVLHTTTRKNGEWVGTTPRNIKKAVVTSHVIEKKPCLKVTLSNGDEIITTPDHFWLSMGPKDDNHRWRTSADLYPGIRINKYWKPWDKDQSYEAGWFAGFLDGEGTLSQSGRAGASIAFCQRPGAVWTRALEFCKRLGFVHSTDRKPRTGGLGKQDALYSNILGGKFKTVELIGRLDVARFKSKFDWGCFGLLKGKTAEQVTVVSVEDAGEQEVAVMATSSKTFFAAGYPMHNCAQFDVKKFNTRAIFYGLNPPRPYSIIDTLKIARRHFGFTSNKLAYLARFLGLDAKDEAPDWKKVIEGDVKEINHMVKYCNQDIKTGVQVYEALRAWDSTHPNLNAFKEEDEEHGCPCCGGTHLVKNKTYTRKNGDVVNAYRCGDCGHQTSDNYKHKKQKPFYKTLKA